MMVSADDRFARASVTVPVSPDRAFAMFVNDVGRWWRPGTGFWMQPDRAIEMRFEPRVGGRMVEVLDASGEGVVYGWITAYEPGRRLAFSWRLPFWDVGADSDVTITFVATGAHSTRVDLTHDFAAAGRHAREKARYLGGWQSLLGYYAEHIAAPTS